MLNVVSLTDELTAAGLPVVGVSSDGRIDYSRDLTPEEQATAQSIIAAHDPDKRQRDETTALDQAKAAVADLRLYIDRSNPTNAQTAAALKLLIRVVIWLLRNEFRG